MITKKELKEAKEFYENRIKGWMLSDLKKSIKAETNFLTALGCLVYTEIIGAFLPPLEKEVGKIEEKRFYRCLFRLKSKQHIETLDRILRKESNKGIYGHLRHNMTHKYFPVIAKREGNVVLFIKSLVARDGIIKDEQGIDRNSAPPFFMSDKGEFVIATRNYAYELEEAVNEFIKTTFVLNKNTFQEASIQGIDIVLKGKDLYR